MSQSLAVAPLGTCWETFCGAAPGRSSGLSGRARHSRRHLLHHRPQQQPFRTQAAVPPCTAPEVTFETA
eukprot:2350017-Rhodomonas_salina.1